MMNHLVIAMISIISLTFHPEYTFPQILCDEISLQHNQKNKDFTVIHIKLNFDGIYFLFDNKRKYIKCIEVNNQFQGFVSNDLFLGGEASDVKSLVKIVGEIGFEHNREATPDVMEAVTRMSKFKKGQIFYFNGQKMKIEIAARNYFYAIRID